MLSKIFQIMFVAFVTQGFSAIPTGDTVSNSIGMKFKRIPAGTFEMGFEGDSLDATVAWAGKVTLGIYNEHPRHAVTLSNDFYIGIYEVTNIQFKKFRSTYGSDITWYDNRDSVPAYRITWPEAKAFCDWLTANDANGYTYRLPTEAEWEYCCRAGTTTPFYTGDSITSSDAHFGEAYGWQLDTVGQKPANPWGLYDMHGNVAEWCLDWYGLYKSQLQTDPAVMIAVISVFREVLEIQTTYSGCVAPPVLHYPVIPL
jgi:formylglycine-generating enzyme required for sulfatase activity